MIVFVVAVTATVANDFAIVVAFIVVASVISALDTNGVFCCFCDG